MKKLMFFLFLSACATNEGSLTKTELCYNLSQEYTNCIITYCNDNSKYSWDMFFNELSKTINDDCLTSSSRIYSNKFLSCFSKHSCKEILMFDSCEVGLQAQNYCGVTRLN